MFPDLKSSPDRQNAKYVKSGSGLEKSSRESSNYTLNVCLSVRLRPDSGTISPDMNDGVNSLSNCVVLLRRLLKN